MNMSAEEYRKYVQQTQPRSPIVKDTALAFVIGGLICLLGQAILEFWKSRGLDAEMASTATSVSLVGLSALLTGLNLYNTVARFGGAGTLVPITGFANAVASPAIDSRAEGLVLGVGAKIFTVCGPVLLYGSLSGALYGFVYWWWSTVMH